MNDADPVRWAEAALAALARLMAPALAALARTLWRWRATRPLAERLATAAWLARRGPPPTR